MKLPAPTPALDPARVLTVGELTRRLKSVLEAAVPEIWIRGEVSNLRRQASGHVYFTLKDADSQLPCVFFRGSAMRTELELREGMQLLAYGQISIYEPRGAYQLVVRFVLEDGIGRLRQEFDRLKAKLAGEGLFDAAKKRPLPTRPRIIGFITSPDGAAVRDFISILRRRGWTGQLVILPAKVQGREAAPEMTAQLARAGRLKIFDLLVIGRGGGSLEDLWAFNDEALVRAVATCPVPVISAVGHETDFTLCDFAADRRAETPSAAAELISSAHLEQIEGVTTLALALHNFVENMLQQRRADLELYAHRWQAVSPRRWMEQAHLRLDDCAGRMHLQLRETIHERRDALHHTAAALMAHSPVARLPVERARLEGLEQRIAAAGVERVLARGFVLLSDHTGTPLTRRAQLTSGQKVRARFADGEAGLVAD